MKKIFAIILSLLMVLSLCMAVSAEGNVVPFEDSWKITSSSEFKPIGNAFDGNPATYWHTNYKAEGGQIISKDVCPHIITVDFGSEKEISGWRYTPRRDNESGTIVEYNIYASKDGENYTKIFTGTFDYAKKTKSEFTPSEASWGAYTMKAIKIEVTNGRAGYGTAAEIEFLTGTSGEAIKNGEAFKDGGKEGASDSADVKISGTKIQKGADWKITSSSEFKPIGNAFDGNVKTYWHSNYEAEGSTITKKDTPPFKIRVEFPEATDVSGWIYTPRTDNPTGTVSSYNIYASMDGVNFEKIYTGSFLNYTGVAANNKPESASWGNKKMKAIEIEITGALSSYGSAAEIEFLTGGEAIKDATAFEGEARTGIPYLARKSWSIKVNSATGNQPIHRVLDGDTKTYWHSNYTAKDGVVVSHDNPPYHIDIDFGKEEIISGVNLIPRQDNKNGNFQLINFYAKENAESEWVLLKEKVAFDDSVSDKELFFLSNIKATAIRIEAIAATGGYGTLAEVYVLSENTDFETVSFDKFAEVENAGTLYSISAKNFTAEYEGTCWDTHTPKLLFDESTKTFWQTEELKTGEDVILFVDLGQKVKVKEIRYTPRQTKDFHGCWLSVDIFASPDNENWFPLFENFKIEKGTETVKFTLPEEIDIRYVEFTITDYFAKRVAASEISFYQTGGHDNSVEKYVLKIGSNEIKYNNGSEEGTKTIDVAPYIVNGTTLIPLRGLLELMGAEISWNGENETIGVKGKEIDLTLQIDYKIVHVNDPVCGNIKYTLRTVPVIKDSRTFIPVRFVSEQLGYTVAWNGETGEITITK